MNNDLKIANGKVQESLEAAILRYQKSLLSNNKILINKYYKEICKLYPPYLHMQEWWNQYHYLYDSHDDFASDYIKIFCNVLSNWKPRSTRKTSRYGGSGEFKNYFIGALQHNYINLVKADNAGKRNPSQKCPICEKWVNPLSTHVLHHHTILLWDYLNLQGYILEQLEKCPFCKSHKMPKTFTCDENCENQVENGCEKCIIEKRTFAIKKHLLSKHSTMLFQRFNELYPNHQTVSPRALSVYMAEENDSDENCYYDQIKDNRKIDSFLEVEMSDLENRIIQNALNGSSSVKFDAKLYNCSMEEFNGALESIKNKMSLFGLEG